MCFLGYYGSRENSLHFEDRYILVAKGKGETPSDLPTDIDDLKVLFEEGNFLIYGKEGANFKKDLGSKFLSAVKGLTVDGPFINFSVVVMAGSTSFYMSCDDSLMALPFEKPFESRSRNHFIKDLLEVFSATDLIR